MEIKTAFAGHSNIPIHRINIKDRLKQAIIKEIEAGCFYFTMGTYGEFDKLALECCRELRKIYDKLYIEVVITSFNQINPEIIYDPVWGNDKYIPYQDVKTIMYDIEEVYFKNRIIASNRQMIDNCDTLICYINTKRYRSGAKKTYYYAKRKGLKIINLFKPEDEPFYFMTKEERKEYFKTNFKQK